MIDKVLVDRELLGRISDMLTDCRSELYAHTVSPHCKVDPTVNSPSLLRLDAMRDQLTASVSGQPHPSAAQSAPDEREAELIAALEHIAKTCNRSRTSTRRLRWIEQRAKWAIEGKPYDRDAFDLPKEAGNTAHRLSLEVARLKAELAEVQRAQSAPVVPEEAMKLLEIARPYMKGPFGSVCGVWQERYARLLAAASKVAPHG